MLPVVTVAVEATPRSALCSPRMVAVEDVVVRLPQRLPEVVEEVALAVREVWEELQEVLEDFPRRPTTGPVDKVSRERSP